MTTATLEQVQRLVCDPCNTLSGQQNAPALSEECEYTFHRSITHPKFTADRSCLALFSMWIASNLGIGATTAKDSCLFAEPILFIKRHCI